MDTKGTTRRKNARLVRRSRWTAKVHPIGSYGVVGNNRTAILIGPDGSVDWAPFPRFDSSPLFAALLDARRGGFFALRPRGRITGHESRYLPRTNVLEQRFVLSSRAEVRLLDFCPEVESDHILMSELHRRISVVKGTADIELLFAPRFNCGKEVPRFVTSQHG
ncbi:MAG: trehalase-like domain-containing protein, partial [Thermoplasmata archaeon]